VKLFYKVGYIAKVGIKLCDFEVSAEDVDGSEVIHHHQETKPTEAEQQIDKSNKIDNNIIMATPAVRFLAEKNAVDLSQIVATGREGRITKGDIIEFLKRKDQPKQPPLPPTKQQVTTPPAIPPTKTTPEAALISVVGKEEDILVKEVIPLRGYHRTMARAMAQSLTIPHLGYCDEIDMDKLIEFRKTLKPLAEQRNIKLSYMPFIIKACSLAMKRYPLINSRINNELTEITLISSHNIAIAIATEFGLTVPNIKNVQTLTLFEVAERLSEIIERASQNKLTPHDLQSPTFSLSNIGVIGGTYASPVLVVPQVCIGAIGKLHKLPRYNSKNEIYPAYLMNISWSADHRVIDGATIANFSNLVKQYLEEPLRFVT
jgi:2-oxoisovalerate dehydrogenase E2 component (dihydrolipoyl transacylase)